MSKPIERPKEPGNKGKPIIHWIHTLWQRVTGHGTPERAETPEESPGGEYNKAYFLHFCHEQSWNVFDGF